MRRPVPVEALIMGLLRDKGDMWYNDLVQALRAYYQDITDKEVLRALMRLELGRLVIVQRVSRKDGPTLYVRLYKE
ncbi:hypothetical protein [Vulcanisaeta thermophila]|uniref:hypothetical protein n=1 Tax=Vulcanisaeta thermophila TaxID=867917 RepID=UPI000853D654|nr:hypothetical protein [Vulcanisaeta thermophila]